MKHVRYDARDECLKWAAERIGLDGFGSQAHAIGMYDGDQLRAVTIWDTFSPWNCVMGIASDGTRRWMTRDFLFRSFAYPFLQLKLRRATVMAATDNEDSIRLGKHLGFTVECERMRNLFGDKDAVVMGLLREDCRFIKPPFAPAIEGNA